MGVQNIECHAGDGIEFLKNTFLKFDWVYVDPSRRNDQKGKVFLLKDCLPNLPEHLPSIFEKTNHILIKTSPLLDIKKGMEELEFVKEIHVVATNNEVKELLFVLQKDFEGDVQMKTINLNQGNEEVFEFVLPNEPTTEADFGAPSSYLYEPNAAILKSGGFKSIGKAYHLKKLNPSSHLYTSEVLVDFPGRRFEIVHALPYSKKSIKALKITKANITTRNFPMSVADVRKKHGIKDGGDDYMFFTKDVEDKLLILLCRKV